LETSNYFLFLVTSFIVIIAPGPGMLFVISSGIGGGCRAGIHAALGTSAGISIHIIATMFGISVLLQTSAFAFGVLKIVGARIQK
jgi:threonine/homoserine/homoserine lactone efflux protein